MTTCEPTGHEMYVDLIQVVSTIALNLFIQEYRVSRPAVGAIRTSMCDVF